MQGDREPEEQGVGAAQQGYTKVDTLSQGLALGHCGHTLMEKTSQPEVQAS